MAVYDHGLEAIRKSAEEIVAGNKSEYRIRTSAVGTFSLSGLSNTMKTTTLEVTDVPTLLPATPLEDRNHIEIHNLSDDLTLYVGVTTSVTADRINGTTSGKEIPPQSYWNIDITNAIPVYGVYPSGGVAQVKITEVA